MMMFFMLWTTLLVTLVSSQEDACFADHNDPYHMFATATPYRAVNDMYVGPVLLDCKYYNAR
jgi:hypothetical protein